MALSDPVQLAQYCLHVMECHSALQNLHEFAISLPVPEDGQLQQVDQQAMDRLRKFREAIAVASKLADEFWQ